MDFKFWKKKEIEVVEHSTAEPKSLMYIGEGRTSSNQIYHDVWDGEKTPGELGDIYDTIPDHIKLRLRAYDMHLKTDIIRIITGKFFKWVVGNGLKIQAEPNEAVLEMSGIKNLGDFNSRVENLFNLYAGSEYADYHRKDWLHKKAGEAFKTAFLGGDALCIVRFDMYGPNVQVVDGQQVETPLDDKDKAAGNIIRHGIELNKKGEHAAFWVKAQSHEDGKDLFTHKRVEARNSSGIKVAWMIYGDKARIDHERGIPIIASILEKTAKLDRFVEASVSKAEQTANVVYAFKHNTNSTGENILTQTLSSKKTPGMTEDDAYIKSGKTAAMLRQSTSATVLNLIPDSELISLSSMSETTFNEFFRAVFTTLCAAVDIPEEVALQKYEQNYSSSRAAINGWEHIVSIYREEILSKKFYEPFYRCWLEWQILTEKIEAPGFLNAQEDGDFMAVEAYFNARFTGKKMPHIDPLKEAKAIRSMLGESQTPLISHEQATEALGGGEWAENYKKYLKEDTIIIKPEVDDKNENNKQKS